MKRSLALSCLGLLSIGFVCVGVARAGEPAPDPNPVAVKKVDWEHMSFDERKKLMKTSVSPQLKKAFQAADPKRFEHFTCATCHGEGAKDGKFKMPNPALPRLPPDHAGIEALAKKKPEIVNFMETVVKPKVADLIGLPIWSPQNTKGFGCYGCHTMEKGK